MKSRLIQPEILDSLAWDDPRAVHSRRDLQRIDLFMGNTRWISRQVLKSATSADHIAELGSGDGHFGTRLFPKLPTGCRLTGVDLVPRPENWPQAAEWQQGDLFAAGLPAGATIVTASLFLHHFTDAQLRQLGQWLTSVRCFVSVEPYRSPLHLWQGKMLRYTGTNAVTDHDLAASVRAGFRDQELVQALGLGVEWKIKVSRTFFGGLRLLALR